MNLKRRPKDIFFNKEITSKTSVYYRGLFFITDED